MSMRCMSSGITCAFTCSSRLFFASGAFLAAPSASGSASRSTSGLGTAAAAGAAAARSARSVVDDVAQQLALLGQASA